MVDVAFPPSLALSSHGSNCNNFQNLNVPSAQSCFLILHILEGSCRYWRPGVENMPRQREDQLQGQGASKASLDWSDFAPGLLLRSSAALVGCMLSVPEFSHDKPGGISEPTPPQSLLAKGCLLTHWHVLKSSLPYYWCKYSKCWPRQDCQEELGILEGHLSGELASLPPKSETLEIWGI